MRLVRAFLSYVAHNLSELHQRARVSCAGGKARDGPS